MTAFQKMKTFIRHANRSADRALSTAIGAIGRLSPVWLARLGQMGDPAPLRLYSFPRGIRQR